MKTRKYRISFVCTFEHFVVIDSDDRKAAVEGAEALQRDQIRLFSGMENLRCSWNTIEPMA